MANRTLKHGFSNSTCVLVHTHESPKPDEWEEFVRELEGKMHRAVLKTERLLVFTDGASLDVKQRGDMQRVTKAGLKIAVLTESRVVRGVITALGWFGATIRGFGHAEVDEALGWLVPATERGDILTKLQLYKDELGVGVPK